MLLFARKSIVFTSNDRGRGRAARGRGRVVGAPRMHCLAFLMCGDVAMRRACFTMRQCGGYRQPKPLLNVPPPSPARCTPSGEQCGRSGCRAQAPRRRALKCLRYTQPRRSGAIGAGAAQHSTVQYSTTQHSIARHRHGTARLNGAAQWI